MDDIESSPVRQALLRLRPVLLPLAIALFMIALWLAWSAAQQFQDAQRRAALESSRDTAAQFIAKSLSNDHERLSKRLVSPEVQLALKSGDLIEAGRQVMRGWQGVEEVAVLPVDLEAAYVGLPKSGFGRLAIAEAALAENKIVDAVVRDGDGPRLAFAAPLYEGKKLSGIVYVRLPITRVTVGLDAVNLVDDTYMALRQGGVSLHERGEATYAEGAERMAVAIPGTPLRLAAAVPDPTTRIFGFNALASLIASIVFLGFAGWMYLLSRRRALDPSADIAISPTLAQVMSDVPLEKPVLRVETKEAPKPVIEIASDIFRAYDIRGVVGESLDASVAGLIGQAVGTLMLEKDLSDIVVGRDGRLSGPDMVSGLIEGLRRAGCNVIDIGLAPTPVVYFGAFHMRTGCCIAVTGSHNPPNYNGFKIVVGGETLSGDAILDLHARIAEDRLHIARTPGNVVQREIGEEYVARIASDVQIDRRVKVVVDAGNGVAGELGPRVLEAIGAEVIPLHCEIDGNFPNHHPDPSEPANLQDLIQMVEHLDAEMGIAFDGDGDRLGIVTRQGDIIYADRLLMLFAADVLERNPGAVIVYDVKCTGHLSGYILRHGGSPLMWKTGHSLIKAKMRETEAELAGEMSGHFFFAERWYGFDDGIYAAARLLEILAASASTPSEVLNALPNGVSTPEIKIDAPDGNPHAFVELFREQASFPNARLSTIDGLRADWPDGWGLVRASNTTPVLVLRFDADTQEALHRIQDAFRAQLHAIAPDLPIKF